MRLFALAVFVMSLVTIGCTEWYPSARGTNSSYPPQRIPRARVSLANGRTVQLLDARIRSDSVTGFDPVSASRIGFPLSRVARIESHEFSLSRTVLLSAGLGVAVVAITLVMAAMIR